jgi:hypothetical protein
VRLAVSGIALLLAAATPLLPRTPAPVRGVLFARAFTLDTGFRYGWSADHPEVREGWMLVLEADPALARARETQEPVLFAGRHVVQRISRGGASGRIVVLVPARIDLETEPVWFGTPGLPEQIDGRIAEAERTLALASGIGALGRAAVSAARERGGGDVRFASKRDLFSAMQALVQEYVESQGPSR